MQRMETVKQSGPWNSLCTRGSMMAVWLLCISSRVKPEKLTFKSNLTLKIKVNYPPPPPHPQPPTPPPPRTPPPTPTPTPPPPTPTPTPTHHHHPHPPPTHTHTKKILGILTNVFCTPGPNLVILAWMVLSYGADTLKWGKFRLSSWIWPLRSTQMQATTISEGQNWLRVKTQKCMLGDLY